MFRALLTVSILLCGVLYYSRTSALEVDKMKRTYLNYVIDCMDTHDLNADEMLQVRRRLFPETQTIKCFYACVYKRSGVMNDTGHMSIDGINVLREKYLIDNEEKYNRSAEIAKLCEHVNELEVTDGEEGCERAFLMYHCGKKHSTESDFVL